MVLYTVTLGSHSSFAVRVYPFIGYNINRSTETRCTGVVGCKERGRQVDGPLDHSTGKGWVKDHAYGKGWVKTDTGWKWMGAQYYDAKWVKKESQKPACARGNFWWH